MKTTSRTLLALGSKAHDPFTGLEGTITLVQIELGGIIWYCIQPKGFDPKDNVPYSGSWIPQARVKGTQTRNYEFPEFILGTKVEDTITGFKGTAVALVAHLSGCMHVDIQPKLIKDGRAATTRDFNITRLKGPAITKLTEEQKQVEEKIRPSPDGPARR